MWAIGLIILLGDLGSPYTFHTLKPGETFPTVLTSIGVPDTIASKITTAIGDKLNLRKCRAGDEMAIAQRDGKFIELKYAGLKTTIIVDSLFQVSELEITKQFVSIEGTITNGSLWDAVIAAGGTPSLVYRIANEIFSSDIDFNVETQDGDKFKLLAIAEYSGDRFIGYSEVISATYTSNKKEITGLYYDKVPHPGYYSLDGKSLQRLLLRAPIAYQRISSGFTKARYHPILRKWCAHNGVDYAAPMGTSVRAVGDGVVASAGWHKGYGQLITVQHSNGFLSYYGHLSRIGVRRGERVNQGSLIGNVGMTGLATGPHLHFGLQVYGKWVNPVTTIPPPVDPLTGKNLEEYKNYVNHLTTLSDVMKSINDIPIIEFIAKPALSSSK